MTRRTLFVGAAALALILCAPPANAQFEDTEVSGPGAEPFLLGREFWTWESLPGVSYALYESASPSSGFRAVLDGRLEPFWDVDDGLLDAGRLQHYLVTANDGGADNGPGLGSECPPGAPAVVLPSRGGPPCDSSRSGASSSRCSP